MLCRRLSQPLLNHGSPSIIAQALIEPGTSDRSSVPTGVSENRHASSSSRRPRLATARSRRYSEGAWVSVVAADARRRVRIHDETVERLAKGAPGAAESLPSDPEIRQAPDLWPDRSRYATDDEWEEACFHADRLGAKLQRIKTDAARQLAALGYSLDALRDEKPRRMETRVRQKLGREGGFRVRSLTMALRLVEQARQRAADGDPAGAEEAAATAIDRMRLPDAAAVERRSRLALKAAHAPKRLREVEAAVYMILKRNPELSTCGVYEAIPDDVHGAGGPISAVDAAGGLYEVYRDGSEIHREGAQDRPHSFAQVSARSPMAGTREICRPRKNRAPAAAVSTVQRL
jgi:hypothetical protein